MFLFLLLLSGLLLALLKWIGGVADIPTALVVLLLATPSLIGLTVVGVAIGAIASARVAKLVDRRRASGTSRSSLR